VCCNVLQRVAVSHWLPKPSTANLLTVLCCSVLQCVAVCCSLMQCAAVCYTVLQCVAMIR